MERTLGAPPVAIAAELVVASDVHLRTASDERAVLLLDVVERLGPVVEYLVLNGDIMDFCFGGSRYFQEKFAPLGRALTAAAARGIKVVFVEGNHEFHMAEMRWDGVEVVTARDKALRLSSGAVVQLSHGDLLGDDPWYRLFRRLVKSAAAKWGAKRIPGRWLDAYALKHAQVSRSQDKYRRLDHGRILAAANQWLRGTAATHGVIGHFHVPYAERREIGDGLLLSVESWDRPNVLALRGGGFYRAYLQQAGAPLEWEPVESVFKGGH